ncbi:MAG: flagellar hook protein FlgE [Fimbriimonadaceae bacterium]|nr:flagellar hook protein FlgE [Fimbriimonadaceae bacterium]
MLQAMLAGVASIKAQQTRMNVIGNNLANVNTTAYKGSRVTFKDMLAQTIRGSSGPTASAGGLNPIQYGLGVLISGTDISNEQGSLNATNRPTDMAIQGNGFFLVGNGDGVSYTRDGAFDLDGNGDLVHRATGQRLLGWTADSATGNIDTNAPIGANSILRVPIGARTAVQVTTTARWAGNLDAQEVASPGPPAYPDPGYRETLIRVFDSLGTQHDITLRLIKTAANTWNYSMAGNNGETITGSGDLVFNPTTGALASGSPAVVTITPAAGGAPPFDVSMDFGGVTQLASETQVQAASQNGFPPGSLQSFSIGQDGVITGLYTNGLARPLGQLGMAIFPNANGLERMGNNLWRNNDNSGVPVVGPPVSGGRGTISSGFLEQSNIDIGNEFTELIITQRGFQANTRVVTTVDEMLQDLINMKR